MSKKPTQECRPGFSLRESLIFHGKVTTEDEVREKLNAAYAKLQSGEAKTVLEFKAKADA